ncbi:MAG: hypothetical protein VX835_01880 [Pseudomonadota bacterium]|nr:hypothetical protein [Pseudomonadota bacterium]
MMQIAVAQTEDDSGTSPVSVDTIFANLSTSLGGVSQFLTALAYVMGIYLTVSAVFKFKKFGHRTAFMHVEAGMFGPIMQFFIGVAMLYMPTFIGVLNATVFGDSAIDDVMAYTSSGSSPDWANAISPMYQAIQIIGMIAFLRGWLILSKSVQKDGGNQPGQITKGVIHIIGGVLAMNITRSIEILTATFGLT